MSLNGQGTGESDLLSLLVLRERDERWKRGNLLLVFLCRPIARHFRSAVRSCSFLKLEAGKELPLCFLHLDGGSGTGLTSGLPVEIIQGDIVPQKPGHAR